ncbi:SHOCT domain-containing protein [Streptomyces flavofungini]|uniref:PLDc N-terminal domain-containing protein n=1 Tax=Streptomyces flavofungini TaxID=68200 RepID=A0ABS0X9E0_9ACTN|nr:SHOCT domain-containing protein [Streptomyces flavofungini]MBJ3809691.1 PLDc N-terminal domain-containing protein [Streptomyces flavofungini]GHC80119.1 membrane protein [Streptomyces flavofungini]
MDYPLLNLFLTMLWFFLWTAWLILVFRMISDIFRSHDLSGWAKTGWLLCVLVLPFIGVFVYLIVRGRTMGERDMREVEARDAAFRAHVREASRGSANGGAGELAQLAELRRTGELTDQEYQRAKTKFLAS